jgi:general secretion pathway protein F
MLLLVGLLVAGFLIGFVVPKFAGVYKDSGSEMPWASALLFDIGRVIGAHPFEIVSGVLLLVAALVAAFSMPATRTWFGLRIRALPGVGVRLRVYELARLYRTLAMLLRGGTPIVPALGLAATMLSGAMREQLANASRQISQGEPISRALDSNGLTTKVGNRMLSVGERSGGMSDMLGRIADYHDEETARWVEWAVRLFEPVLMALLGVLIGGIVILLYMPIFDLAGSVKQ